MPRAESGRQGGLALSAASALARDLRHLHASRRQAEIGLRRKNRSLDQHRPHVCANYE